MFLTIMFEEVAQCAGAELDFNPCLVHQIFEKIFSSDDPNPTFDGVRRKLEQRFDNPGEFEPTDLCASQPNEAELYLNIRSLLAGSQEQCIENGVTFERGEIEKARTELFKLFSAQQCWGISNNCTGHNIAQPSSYLEFIEGNVIGALGQCANVEEISCVFSKSVKLIYGLSLGGHSQSPESIICTAPNVHAYDIEQIASLAKEHCLESGALVLDLNYYESVNDLKVLMARPECWEGLCEQEAKDAIAVEWMQTCAMMDLKFLTTLGSYNISSKVSLKSDRLRCMAEYIASANWESHANWACSLPHLGNDICGLEPTKHGIGKEAYFHCGVETLSPTPPPLVPLPSSIPTSLAAPSPSEGPMALQFSMSFAYDDIYDWAHFEPDMSFSLSLEQLNGGAFSMSYGDWHEGEDLIQTIDASVLPSFAPSELEITPVAPTAVCAGLEHACNCSEYPVINGVPGYCNGYTPSRGLFCDSCCACHENLTDSQISNELDMSMHIEEVCSLISELNIGIAQRCLQPVCDIRLEAAFTTGADTDGIALPTLMPTIIPSPPTSLMTSETPTGIATSESPTLQPSSLVNDASDVPTPVVTSYAPSIVTTSRPTASENPTSQLPTTSAVPTLLATTTPLPTLKPTDGPTSAGPTLLPTTAPITPLPTLKPTSFLTSKPSTSPIILSASPTVEQFGSVEVSFEVEVTLEGIDVSDLDITAINDVVNLLEAVFADMLPPGAIVRLLKVGGFSVTRRLLRFLEEDSLGGVEVEFEIIMTQVCSSAKCEETEVAEISESLYQEVSSDFEQKVTSGELTTSIQEEAESRGVSEMSDVVVNASAVHVGKAKVTVKEAKEVDAPADPTDDDGISSSRHSRGTLLSAFVGVVLIVFILSS